MSGTSFTWKRCARRLTGTSGSSRSSAFDSSDSGLSDAEMVPVSETDGRDSGAISTTIHSTTVQSVSAGAEAAVGTGSECLERCSNGNTADSFESSHELRKRGVALAELGRFWQALAVWNRISTSHVDASLLEMTAQAQLELAEIYPALESASRAVRLAPLWAPGLQTLARSLMHVGEPGLAKRSFCVAFHLQPELPQLVSHDLLWCCQVLADACERVRLGSAPLSNSVLSQSNDDTMSEPEDDTTTDAEEEPRTRPLLTSLGGVVSQDQSDFICAELGLAGVKLSMAVPRNVLTPVD